MRWWLVMLVACGDNLVPPPDASIACVAKFAGNFAETATAPDCAALADGTLTLTIPANTLAAPLVATFQLGTASPGAYSPATVAVWSAMATQDVFGGSCSYTAGSTSVPPGTFALSLTALDPHGSLDITQSVESFPSCGTVTSETVSISF